MNKLIDRFLDRHALVTIYLLAGAGAFLLTSLIVLECQC